MVVLLCCQAREYAETLENAVWTNQFDNRANRKAHYETTGPEIWQQTGGRGYSDVEKCWGTLVCFKGGVPPRPRKKIVVG